jgi:riboflavin kinase/FMN adenylyltransferase
LQLAAFCHWPSTFVIRISFVIRHSSFVITVPVIHSPEQLQQAGRRVCLAIGFFDGVHLGHQQIIRQTISDARSHGASSLIVTFDVHPNTVVAPDRAPPLIYSLPQKLRVLEALGADSLLLLHFDRTFSEQTGDKFIRGLVSNLGSLQSLCVGANFVFGHKRGGNIELLRKLGGELGFTVHGMAAVSLDGLAVSSTRVREAIASGDLDAASQMLGRAYSLGSQVVHGDGLGRQIGIPTANLDVRGLALPPKGVYAAHADVGGKTCRAVLNIGHRPTVQSSHADLRLEAHLLDFQGDLYGQELEVTFAEKLREEMKFASLDELRAQIAQDIREAQRIFQVQVETR